MKNKNMISKIKYEYLLFLIAIIGTIFFLYVIQLKVHLSPTGDDTTYLLAAKKLYFHGLASDDRPILISLIDGFPFLFGFPSSVVINWGIFVNYCCWLFTVILIFKIIADQLNRKIAFFGALFFLTCIGNLAIAFNFLSESIFIFMLVLSVFFANKYFKTNNTNFITLGIAVLTFAILIKPMSIGLVFIVTLFFFKKLKSVLWNKFSGLILIGLSMIFFQMYSLKQQYGDYTISYIDSITYYNYLGAKADCLKKGIAFFPGDNERALYFSKFTSHEQRKIANDDMKTQLKNNTVNLFKAYLFCIYSNTSKGSFIISQCENEKQTFYFDAFKFLFKAISKVQNILLTIIAVLLSFYSLTINRKNQSDFNRMISVIILYIFFISAISCFQCDRFHIVFYPLIIILSATYLSHIGFLNLKKFEK